MTDFLKIETNNDDCKDFVSIEHVIKKIKKYNIYNLVKFWRLTRYEHYKYFLTGKEIFNYIFKPDLSDKYSKQREVFLTNIDFKKLNFNNNEKKVFKIIFDAIEDHFSKELISNNPPLWCTDTYFEKEYPMYWNYTDKTQEKIRINARKLYKEQVANNGYTLTDLAYHLKNKDKGYYVTVHDATMLEEFPIKYREIKEEWKQKRHEQRLWVSRVIMKKRLPCDIVPWVCAYAVPESKIWSYML